MTTSDCIRVVLEEEDPGIPPAGKDWVVDEGIFVKDGNDYVTDDL